MAPIDQVRDKPRHSWRGRIARTAQPSYNLMWCLLLFDVLPNNRDWRSAATPRKVAW